MGRMHHQPQGAAFDIVLLLHVGCVVVGLATMATSAATAARLRRILSSSAPPPPPVVRYFRPGINWAPRTMYGIPIFGIALVAMSSHAYTFFDGWVMAGSALLVAVVLLAEGVLWPAERRLQVALSSGTTDPLASGSTMRDARVMALSSMGALVLLIVGSVLMVAQP
jgi:hypothetical protein